MCTLLLSTSFKKDGPTDLEITCTYYTFLQPKYENKTYMATLVKRSAGWKKAKMRRESVEREPWSKSPREAASSPRPQALTRRRTALMAVLGGCWGVGGLVFGRGGGG